jgi:hypothetical protein
VSGRVALGSDVGNGQASVLDDWFAYIYSN